MHVSAKQNGWLEGGTYRYFKIHRQLRLTFRHNFRNSMPPIHYNNAPLSPRFDYASMGISSQRNKRSDDDEYRSFKIWATKMPRYCAKTLRNGANPHLKSPFTFKRKDLSCSWLMVVVDCCHSRGAGGWLSPSSSSSSASAGSPSNTESSSI